MDGIARCCMFTKVKQYVTEKIKLHCEFLISNQRPKEVVGISNICILFLCINDRYYTHWGLN